MLTILAISHDENLLMNRAAVLRRTDAKVVTAGAKEAKRLLKKRRFDLVVLCHSLSVEETLEIASLAHQQTIAIPILKVIPKEEPFSEWRFITPASKASSDPRILMEKVAELLSVSASGHNGRHAVVSGEKHDEVASIYGRKAI